jgi:hypothetical protein
VRAGFQIEYIKRYGAWTSDAIFAYVRVQLPRDHKATIPDDAHASAAQQLMLQDFFIYLFKFKL